jgi:hypothetical protein
MPGYQGSIAARTTGSFLRNISHLWRCTRRSDKLCTEGNITIRVIWRGTFAEFANSGFYVGNHWSRAYNVQYWPMVPRTSYALEVRDICNTRATNASWSACQMQLRRANVTHMLCECYADVLQTRRASYARHSSSKCDVKRAGCAHYTRCTRREKRASSMGYFCSVL